MSTAPGEHATISSDGSSARRQVRFLLCVALPFTLLLAALAGYTWWAEASYTGESLGVGYVLAILAGVPAAIALLLSAAAFLLRRRFAATAAVLAWFAAVTAVAPVAFVGFLALPSLLPGL